MSELVKVQTLAHLLTWKQPVYVGLSDDGFDSSVREIKLDEGSWADLGCPSTVTVTIEPGDLLNGGAE